MSRATFNELLIAEVAKRPILWDVKSKHFRNKQKKMILWEEVAEILKEVDGSRESRKKELETVDDELNAVRNVIAAHKAMDANGLFLLSLKPYLQSTPQEMLTDLKMDLLHICSTYSEGRRPLSLRSYDW
ncbi:uncharacterized protein LOC142786998 [Rhipicephalus microplus]|uniref:uncharacterized protein LOC142786998 n=1 Tax=Rhipicephalus microplus TaxID=6941 RepID=UPI003F6CDBC2